MAGVDTPNAEQPAERGGNGNAAAPCERYGAGGAPGVDAGEMPEAAQRATKVLDVSRETDQESREQGEACR